jgi:outer membrane lipoprotein
MKHIAWFMLVILVAGCASQPPAPIRNAPAVNLSVDEVRADVNRFIGSPVRWGGTISKVENKANQTWIEIIARDLHKDAQPKISGPSGGRFIASFQGFADPAVYSVGDLLTVVGSIEGKATRPIGEYSYDFPVVAVTGSYLWRVEAAPGPADYPPPWWYYDPWPIFPGYYSPYFW